MSYVSRELVLIINLYNAAKEHKSRCRNNCNISLLQLKQAAQIIRQRMQYAEEIPEVNKMFDDWPS